MSHAVIARLSAPLVWRRPRNMARKLAEFGATEAGSALDMLRASELCPDPRLRRIFLRHALDEARHARLFRHAADQLDPRARHELSSRAQSHQRLRDLYAELGAEAFLAFVLRAEQSGEGHFRALVNELGRSEPELATLFLAVAKDEQFHVAYSAHWLTRLAGPRRPARIRAERLSSLWLAWRRAGRQIGERVSWVLGVLLYFAVLPPFALMLRRLESDDPGWKPARSLPSSIEEARRQF